ncbi:MAG: hypothetical protein CMP59_06660 [Flavobacteriales bacterium]|nr:hypothetical protein [Flavobacteriales bacterium]
MKHFVLFFTLLISLTSSAQINRNQLCGKWMHQNITDSQDSVVVTCSHMIYDGPSILMINKDSSFLMAIGSSLVSDTLKIEGSWALSDSILIMKSEDEIDSLIVRSVAFGRMKLKSQAADIFIYSNYIRLE